MELRSSELRHSLYSVDLIAVCKLLVGTCCTRSDSGGQHFAHNKNGIASPPRWTTRTSARFPQSSHFPSVQEILLFSIAFTFHCCCEASSMPLVGNAAA